MDRCALPRERGMCQAFFPKFYYDKDTKACEKFIYGGCQGNGNRFDTIDECNKACIK